MSDRRELTTEEQEEARRLRKIWNEKKEELNLSQAKAAEALGFNSQGSVSQFINGRVPLNAVAASKFARLLGVRLADISPRWAAAVDDKHGYLVPSADGHPPIAISNALAHDIGLRQGEATVVELPERRYVLVDTGKTQPGDGLFVMRGQDGPVLVSLASKGDKVAIEFHGRAENMTVTRGAFGLMNIVGKAVATFMVL